MTWRYLLRCLMIWGLFFLFSAFVGHTHSKTLAQGNQTNRPVQPKTGADLNFAVADPLPGGCGRATPAGASQPVCCISGYVFLEGHPIAGAQIQIENERGNQQSLVTQIYTDTSTQPIYQLSLSSDPLSVVVGETITVTARYGELQKRLRYVVQPGGQRLDLVLVPQNIGQSSNYLFAREIWGQANPGRLQHPHNIAINSKDERYVLDTDNARVQVFDQQGQFQRGWGTRGNQPGQFAAPMGITVDASDNIYVADTANHRIQKFSRTGDLLLTLGGLGNAKGQFRNPEGVAVSRDGSIYVADSQNNRIQKFNARGQWLLTWGGAGSGNSQFLYPTDLAFDSQDMLYVVDYQNYRVQKFDGAGKFITKWGSQCSNLASCKGGEFHLPDGIAIDQQDQIYISDASHRVQQFTKEGAFLAQFGSKGVDAGQFNFPKGMAVDHQNNLDVADEFNNRIQQFNASLVWRAGWGDQGSNDRQLAQPGGAVADGAGNLYVADTGHHRIQKFGADGAWQSNFGIQGSAPGQLNQPNDIAIDSQGNLYVADTNNQRIQKFSQAGVFIKAWGNAGSGAGQFSFPSGLAVDSQDYLYIADTFNHRIQKFTNNGAFVKSWGEQGINSGQMNAPEDLAIDAQDNLYVADTFNHRIQKFTSAGAFVKSWGGQGSRNGEFDTVTSIAVDNAGNLLTTDNTLRVQKFSAEGVWQTTWGERGVLPGQLHTPLRVTTAPQGVYVSDTDNNRIQLFTAQLYTKPIATITSLSKTTLSAEDQLVAYGLGQDSDQTQGITTYRWVSVEEGEKVLGTSMTLSILASQLKPGRPLLGFQVQDDEGEWSDLATERIVVYPSAEPVQHPWAMLLYLAGDYDDHEELFRRFNQVLDQLCTQVMTNTVRIAAQLDGPGNGDTSRILIDPQASTPCQYELIGEQAMDQPAVLADFVAWGQQKFPAQQYYLSIANHGQGVQGIAWDKTSDLADDKTPNYSAYLSIKELSTALKQSNVLPVQVLQLDACSMNLVETAYELQDRTQFLIASQYLGWDYFAYNDYAQAMATTAQPAQMAQAIVDHYAGLAENDQNPYTIAALDMQRASPTLKAIDALAAELQSFLQNDPSHQAMLAQLWDATAKFESNGNHLNDPLDVYIDLVQWAQLVAKADLNDPAVNQQAAILLEELIGQHRFISTNRHQSNALPSEYGGAYIELKQANGISIFYPGDATDPLYKLYTSNVLFGFTESSRWPQFLTNALGTSSGQPPLASPLAPLKSQFPLYLSVILR